MNEWIQAVHALQQWLTVDRAMFLYFIYNSAVQSLPEPEPDSGRLYIFVFRFAHALAANINVVRKRRGNALRGAQA